MRSCKTAKFFCYLIKRFAYSQARHFYIYSRRCFFKDLLLHYHIRNNIDNEFKIYVSGGLSLRFKILLRVAKNNSKNLISLL
jgi:hypothetical protein